MKSEDELLRWLRGQLGSSSRLGDDAALLPAGGPLAVTVDSQIAGTHFVPGLDPARIARRLLAVNLSDLAATGAVPAHGFLALSTPPGFDHERFFAAFVKACLRHGVELAGGDLARSAQVTATLTLLGRIPEGGRRLSRQGAKPGHSIWLGGTVGESAAGRLLIERGARWAGTRVDLPASFSGPASLLAAARKAVRRHLEPEPQIDLGLWLGKQKAGAAMDVSDGLARDLPRLCRESGVGAELRIEDLPLAGRFPALVSALAADALDLALGGGEDYVLLFTLPPEIEPPAGCRKIGEITRRKQILLIEGRQRRPLPDAGWDHLK